MITLFYAPLSCATVSHIALEESGLEFEARRISFSNEEDMVELRRANPDGKIPAALIGDVGLSENLAIVSYVAALAPNAGILPIEPLERARCIALLAWSASTVHPNFRRTARPERFTADPDAFEGVRASGREAFWGNLLTIDKWVEQNEWMLGETYSAADAYALRFYDWGRLKGHPIEQLGGLGKFIDRMIARPAVRRTLEREESPLLT